ncbi:BfmA/BtgA family mobilization protein [Proteiniphilum saccharofermentans]|uniref:BfmA/BtgA family mobilization protein n=1 Tax=Proteiniphilum saccharofermentans TaxID=1642647 RepID=UPI0028B059EB|nr:BfmA/BtgA family mobilization protein [Proteiniphilum saccharofermentans]
MTLNKQKLTLTSIGIDKSTNRLIDKLCKRYSLKKGEIVRLAFAYIDKASINPSEPPESAKAELAKINKRQDDLIRFIRHFEEKELNPIIRATNSIAVKFETIVKELSELLLNEINTSRELQDNVLKKISETFTQHTGVINNQAKQINSLSQIQQRTTKKLLNLIQLYSELAACGMMDSKRKENLKNEIINLINES